MSSLYISHPLLQCQIPLCYNAPRASFYVMLLNSSVMINNHEIYDIMWGECYFFMEKTKKVHIQGAVHYFATINTLHLIATFHSFK